MDTSSIWTKLFIFFNRQIVGILSHEKIEKQPIKNFDMNSIQTSLRNKLQNCFKKIVFSIKLPDSKISVILISAEV